MIHLNQGMGRFVHLIRKLIAWLWSAQVYDGMIPIIITFHSFTKTRQLALGLLVIWTAIRLIIQMVVQHQQHPLQLPFEAVFLALILVNTRLIVLREDMDGPTNFLLIALGFLIGGRQSLRQWRLSLGWLALTPILLAGVLVLHHSAVTTWSSTVVKDIYEATMNGHGGINRFATLLMFVTTSAAYFALLSTSRLARRFGTAAGLIGYVLCFSTDSRLAQIAPPIALLVGWMAVHWRVGTTKIVLWAAGALASASVAVGMWWFVLAPDASVNQGSDLGRLEAGRCWLSLMLTGRNRFLYGVGYGPKANEMCGYLKDGKGFGHAHNTIAQLGGQLGVLGILAFLILAIIVSMGLWRQLTVVSCRLNQEPNQHAFVQAAIGFNTLLLLNTITTTIYRGNQVTQCLIGFLASTSLCLLNSSLGDPSASARSSVTLFRSGSMR
jgi:hypothetical protein